MRSGCDLLLIAQSARMLAQSAARGGFRANVLDLYSDFDTQMAGSAVKVLPADWNEHRLLKLADEIAPTQALIYGSGMDNRPDLLDKLAKGRMLFGNESACLRQVNSPQTFFKRLDELKIPYPNTRFTPPLDDRGWLVKPLHGEGGKNVGFKRGKKSDYYQRPIQGEACSILFLANATDIQTIGFNTLQTSDHDKAQPYLFAGAINRAPFNQAQCAIASEYAFKLTDSFGLRGLNSMDFIWDGESIFVLEVNPRPSATLSLYDEDYPEGLVSKHIKACQGVLSGAPIEGPVRIFKIIYAQKDMEIKPDFVWAEGCADKANPGTRINAGEPVCSLYAEGESRDEAFFCLDKRLKDFLKSNALTF